MISGIFFEKYLSKFLHGLAIGIIFALLFRGRINACFEKLSRGVAQPGLEYASGGRVVASSNLVTPTVPEVIEISGIIFVRVMCVRKGSAENLGNVNGSQRYLQDRLALMFYK